MIYNSVEIKIHDLYENTRTKVRCRVIFANEWLVQVNNDIQFKWISPKNGSKRFDEFTKEYFLNNFTIVNEDVENANKH